MGFLDVYEYDLCVGVGVVWLCDGGGGVVVGLVVCV